MILNKLLSFIYNVGFNTEPLFQWHCSEPRPYIGCQSFSRLMAQVSISIAAANTSAITRSGTTVSDFHWIMMASGLIDSTMIKTPKDLPPYLTRQSAWLMLPGGTGTT